MQVSAGGAAALPTLPHRLLRLQRDYQLVDPDHRLDAAVPQLRGLPVLNQRLREVVDAAARSYRKTLRREAGRGPNRYHAMTAGWQLMGRSEETVGIQVWVAQQHGLTVTIDRKTIWYDITSASELTLPDLFTSAGWKTVRQAITTSLAPRPGEAAAVRAALEAGEGQDGKAAAIGFTAEGDLLVTLPPRTMSSKEEPVSVLLPREPLTPRLSAVGRSVTSTALRREAKKHRERQPVDCRKRKCVALTFDDGPGPYTAELVALLQQRKVPATFFVVGDRVHQAPDLLAVIDAAGMEIGNHSSSHDELPLLSAEEMHRDLAAANQAITSVTGDRPTLMRPPYGSRNPTVDEVSKRLDLAEILWDVDTLDWRYPDPSHVRHAAVRPTQRGSIILLHDVHRTTVEAVPDIITDLHRRGYTLVTITELLRQPRPGRTYHRQPTPAQR